MNRPTKTYIDVEKIKGFKKVTKDGEKYIYAKISDTRMKEGKEKGTYLNMCQWEKKSEYSDGFIKEDTKKDEENKVILGNIKKENKTSPQNDNSKPTDSTDDLPF